MIRFVCFKHQNIKYVFAFNMTIIILKLVLALCFAAEVSSIPIVDDNDSLLDIYCRRLVGFVLINILLVFYGSSIKLSY